MYKSSKILSLLFVFALLIGLYSHVNFAQSSDDPEVICKEAIKLFNAGKIAEAEKMFNSALKVSKYSSQSYYYLAQIYSIYASTTEDDKDIKNQMIEKACQYLKNAVSAGFRDYKTITLEKRFEVLRDVDEFDRILKTLEFLIFKESSWAETKSYAISVTFPEKLDFEKKYPLLVYLKNKDFKETENFKPETYPSDSEMACAVLQYPLNEFDIKGGMWSEYTEKRVRKSLEEIKEKNEKRMCIDFSRVYVCGARQAGFRALMTYLSYPDAFAGVITFNAPVYKDSEVYKLIDSHEKKEAVRIIAVQSKKDTLSFAKNDESWKKLKESDVPVDYRVEEDFIFGSTVKNYEKVIFAFIDKEMPKPEKTENGLQTKENKPVEDSDEAEETPENGAIETPATPETPEEPEKENPDE